jgi:hypothetical protein
MIQGPLPSGSQLRFMGQRYIPDSEIMQRLVTPIQRVFPSGLDVMAVLGSNRASAILDAYPQIYNAGRWSRYKPERAKLTQEFARLPQSTWTSNLYWGWLDVLRAVNAPAPAGYPALCATRRGRISNSTRARFVVATAARYLLYGKQSVVQCGGDGEDKPFVKGYVEPNVLFWDRLLKLTQQSRGGLVKRKLLSNELKDKFRRVREHAVDAEAHLAERTGESEADQRRIRRDSLPRRQARLSDAFGHGGQPQQLGTGEPDRPRHGHHRRCAHWRRTSTRSGRRARYEILAIVPIEGKLMLTRGATFSYYEFKHPASDRLTDEKWQAMIKNNRAPLPPVWTKSFLSPVNRA